ncbi:MAG: EVE domain-containing protein [Blastochloris sp.]|nr:EVE domain-containing protein [Blastochloris sp.]
MPNVWLFQFDPKQAPSYTPRVGQVDEWAVSRYRLEIAPGDTALLWRAGDDGGLAALGAIASASAYKDVPAQPDKKFWLTIRCTHIFAHIFRRNEVKHLPALHYMQIISIPFAQNAFAVTAMEWEEIKERLHIP